MIDVTQYGEWLHQVGGGAKIGGRLIGSPARYEYVVIRMANEAHPCCGSQVDHSLSNTEGE